MHECVVRGGTLVTPEGMVRADLAMDAGNITEIGPGLAGGTREIDANGLTVFPGVIDVHVHFNEPGRAEWEGGETGSRAFAAGGGTLFFDMPLNSSPCTLDGCAFDEKRAALEQSSVTDFALWGGLVPGNVEQLPELHKRGVIGFKAFLCDSGLPEFPRADDFTLYEGMRVAAQLGLPVGVHAENDDITRGLAQRALHAGRTGVRDYLNSRPVVAEVEAITRAGCIAREAGAKLHVVHISSGAGVRAALEARALGTDISIETCAHYLFFTEDDLERIGAAAKCAPPLRPERDQAELWAELLAERVDIVGSDHSPAPLHMKTGADFFSIWGGVAGVQSTLAVLLEAGFYGRGLRLERIAQLTAGNPAERFRIGKRGALRVGNAADLALIDLKETTTLEAADLHYRHAISPYAGRPFRGVVRHVFRRGEALVRDGNVIADTRGTLIRPTL